MRQCLLKIKENFGIGVTTAVAPNPLPVLTLHDVFPAATNISFPVTALTHAIYNIGVAFSAQIAEAAKLVESPIQQKPPSRRWPR